MDELQRITEVGTKLFEHFNCVLHVFRRINVGADLSAFCCLLRRLAEWSSTVDSVLASHVAKPDLLILFNIINQFFDGSTVSMLVYRDTVSEFPAQ